MTDWQYIDALRVRQAKIHAGDVRWYVVSANGWIVKGPCAAREDAQAELDQIKLWAHEEDEDGAAA